MLEKEHVVRLKQGVDAWNEWRRKNPDVRPDLSEAFLYSADLSQADLSGADLTGTTLWRAKLRGASLRQVDLSGVDLREGDLTEADLTGVDLSNKDLTDIDLIRANLSGANLSGVDLRGKYLTGANLSGVDLSDKDLRGTKLTQANLTGAILSGVDLTNIDLTGTSLAQATLSQANLRHLDLGGKDLSGSILNAADLRGANLIDAKLDEADLTATRLWGTQRGGWSIKGVICEHAFWDRDGKEPTHYAPGDFERLHAEGLGIELRYEDGMSPIEVDTLPMLIRHLQTSHRGTVLRLRSIEDAAGGVKARIIIEDTGGEDPASLKKDLQQEAEAVQSTLRENLRAKEDQLKLVQHELGVLYEKVFPMMLESKAMAGDKHINIGSIGQVGNIGDITDHANVHIDQSTHYTENDLSQINDLITDILARQADLRPDFPADRLPDLAASLNEIQSQLTQPSPDTSMLNSSLATIRSILEGATGNVVASGWLKVLEGLV